MVVKVHAASAVLLAVGALEGHTLPLCTGQMQ